MPAARSPTVRGRDAELYVLGELLARIRSGRAGVVLIEGAPGLGKSRLLSEVGRIAQRLSVAVCAGAAEPSETAAEFAPLLRALCEGPEPLFDRVAIDGLRAIRQQRYWLLQDLQTLLERAALTRPLLICLDDLQWADGGTLAAVRSLPAALDSLPIGWVFAARPDQGPPALTDAIRWLGDRGAERIALGPLDRDAVAQVALDIVRAAPDEGFLELTDGAGGNPFLLVELLRGVSEEGRVRVEGGRASVTSGQVPDRVRIGMRERLDRLSEPARRTALIAASLGRTFSFSELTAMLGVSPAELLSASDELLRAGILSERGERLAFQHDLTRDGVRGVTGRSARRALDRQAAAVLLSRGALPVKVAAQLAASAEPGDETAIATLHEAAQMLGSADPGAAADLSRRALELAPSGHPLRGPLVAQTTILLHAAARSREAKAFADEHLRAALSVIEESEVLLSIASMFALGPDERAAANRRALALPELARTNRARHLARLTYNLIQAGRHDEAQRLLAQVRDEIMAHGDAASSTIVQHIDSLLLCHEGRFGRALEIHEVALREGFGLVEGTRQRVANLWRSDLLGLVDRLEESMELAVDGIASAQRDRQAWALDYFETWRARQLFLQGKLSDAMAALEGRFEPEDADKIAGMYAGGLATLGRIAIHTEDQERTRATAQVARVMVKTGTPGTARHGAWLLALQAMAAGDAHTACRWLRSGDRLILPLHPIDVTDEPHLVRVALAGGDRELAARAVGLAEQHAARSPEIGSVVAASAHARGLLDDDTSELVRAAEGFGAAPRPLARASALEDLGAALLRGQSRSEGVQALEDALAVYVDTGASWDARRVRSRLRAHGVRRRVTATDRPSDNWSALTDSELAVVRLVSDGRTNREVAERLFISPHTVNSHLRRAFSKLGVNSRVELAGLAARRSAHGN